MSASASLAPARARLPAAACLALACHAAAAQAPGWPAKPPDVTASAAVLPRPAEPPDVTASAAVLPRPAEPPVAEDFWRHYREAMANGEFQEAETAAKRLIDHLNDSGERRYGPMADALAGLAHAQRRRELFEPAIANYQAAIALIEEGDNRLSARLLEPLSALGDTYVESGRPELALPVYEHALHVAQVNDGPHTLEQVEVLDAIAGVLAATGQEDAALQAADRMYFLYARAFSPWSEEVLPALGRKAELLHEFERYADERTVYRDIARIIRDRRGEHDLSLLEVYAALGRTYFHDLDDVYFRSEPTTETGETFLRRALEVSERNPQATWQMQQQALLQLADYYTLRNVQDKARIHYRRAWELLSADAERLERRRRSLERAVLLLDADLDPYANFGYRSREEDADAAGYKNGYVVARFTVNDRGRTSDIEIVAADPPGFAAMETRVRHAVRDLIYRPRYADGGPVATPGQVFRHEYRYRDADLAETP